MVVDMVHSHAQIQSEIRLTCSKPKIVDLGILTQEMHAYKAPGQCWLSGLQSLQDLHVQYPSHFKCDQETSPFNSN